MISFALFADIRMKMTAEYKFAAGGPVSANFPNRMLPSQNPLALHQSFYGNFKYQKVPIIENTFNEMSGNQLFNNVLKTQYFENELQMNFGYDNCKTGAATENTQRISMYPFNFPDSYENNPEKKFNFDNMFSNNTIDQRRLIIESENNFHKFPKTHNTSTDNNNSSINKAFKENEYTQDDNQLGDDNIESGEEKRNLLSVKEEIEDYTENDNGTTNTINPIYNNEEHQISSASENNVNRINSIKVKKERDLFSPNIQSSENDINTSVNCELNYDASCINSVNNLIVNAPSQMVNSNVLNNTPSQMVNHDNSDNINLKDDQKIDEASTDMLNNPDNSTAQRLIKTKKLSCRTCKIEFNSEEQLYEHGLIHIGNKEKILRCEYCPFITPHKHHFEYHMNNHIMNKPFRCDRCDYSCVNKSMLNSHMKSHSNFYPYRCMDCSYETKYMHSLKKHCRTTNHKADSVYNPDGTVNPFIIIDVYGTRRGPKFKRDSEGNVVIPNNFHNDLTGITDDNRDNRFITDAFHPSWGFNPSLGSSPSELKKPTYPGTIPPADINKAQALNPFMSLARMANLYPLHLRSPISMNSPPSFLHSPKSPSQTLEQSFTPFRTNLLRQIAEEKQEESRSWCMTCRSCSKTFFHNDAFQDHLVLCNLTRQNNGIASHLEKPLKENLEKFLYAHQSLPYSPNYETFSTSPKLSSESLRTETAPEKITNVSDEDSEIPLDLTKDHTPPQQIKRRYCPEDRFNITPPSTTSPPKRSRMEKQEGITNDADIVSNYMNKLSCFFCEITFKNLSMYKTHMQFHKELNPLECYFCSKNCVDFMSFYEHCFGCESRNSITSPA